MTIEPKEVITKSIVYVVDGKLFASEDLAKAYVNLQNRINSIDKSKASEDYFKLCSILNEFVKTSCDEIRWYSATGSYTVIEYYINNWYKEKNSIMIILDSSCDYPHKCFYTSLNRFLSGQDTLESSLLYLRCNLKLTHISETFTEMK